MPTKRQKVALYVRVSTEEQRKHGLSVDSQIKALQDYAEHHGYTVAGIYNDAGISARRKYTSRPALLSLVKDCEAGKVDLILFTKLDRWFRSVADYYEVQAKLDQCGVPWRAIWEDYETETSSGLFKVNIMLSVAQAESDRTSERIKAVNDYRRARGDWVGGKAPVGYKSAGPKLLIDPEKQPAVRALFDTYLDTLSTSETVKVVRPLGLNLDIISIRYILKNPTYTGYCRGHRCEAYITEEQHRQIVESMRVRTRGPKRPNRVYYFSGLLFCSECGGLLNSRTTVYSCAADPAREFKYYKCRNHLVKKNCIGAYTSEKKMEEYLLAHLENSLTNLRASLMNIRQDDEGDTQKQIETLKARLTRVGDRYEDGDLSREEYREKRDAIKKEIEALDQKTEPVRELPTLAADWKEVYAALDDGHKKTFWRKTIKKVTVFHDKSMEPVIFF